ncbi:HalD/BesD family halogenase [Ilumatobacter sp.]|uniref:HalD/BesD family halogenase n=1 Tax=Ilumatobacter sp. TaxID=1967498 RepID=UPI003C6662C7
MSSLADPEIGALDGLVDLERYPLDRPGSEMWSELVEAGRRDLAEHGSMCLTQFLKPDALTNTAAEIAAIATHIPILEQMSSVYARDAIEADLDSDDPRRVRMARSAGHVTRDMIPPYSPAHRLYVSACFKVFIAALVGEERVFEYADPLAGLVATVLPPGGSYPWHYDTNEYVVTLMLQPAEEGGVFEYHQNLRSPGDENLAGLGRVLARDPAEPARRISVAAGDLQLFLGRYSLHQVTEVAGTLDRHVLVLSYADRPGVIGPADRTRAVYGRVTEAHLVADQARLAENDGLIL